MPAPELFLTASLHGPRENLDMFPVLNMSPWYNRVQCDDTTGRLIVAAKIPDIRSSKSYTDAAILLWCYNHDNQLRHRHEAIITSHKDMIYIVCVGK